jgi:hypothetical protein
VARVALLLLLVRSLAAQSVEGTLTDRVSRAPLPNVTVTLVGPTVINAVTDGAGVFRSGLLKPGQYRLTMALTGYVLPRAARGFFEVADSLVRLPVDLDPLCRVAGRVTYSDGTAVAHAPVTLVEYPAGRSVPVAADEAGRFVFEDVKPGRYLVRAAPPANPAPAPAGETWTPTADPEPLRLRAGAFLAHDLRLRSSPMLHIRGIVRDEFARPAPGVAVNSVKTGADGTFDLPAYPGDWRLNASETGRRGYAKVTLTRHDVENVDIRMARPLTVAVDTMSMLEAVDAYASAVSMGDVARGVSPGVYRILPRPVAGSYVASVKLGDAEVLGEPVGIWDSSAVIHVRYEKGSATVRGTVEQGGGAAVALYACDAAAFRLDGVHTVNAAADGSFEIAALRPGDYWALAFDGEPPFTLADPALQALAVRVHADKTEAATVKLKVVDWP